MSITISVIKPFEAGNTASFSTMGTPLTGKDLQRALMQARHHLVRRVIPRMGRGNQAGDRTSSMGRILGKHIKQGEHFINEHVVCECGGHFIADKHSNYVCNECGLIEDFKAIIAPVLEAEDIEDSDEPNDEEDFNDSVTSEEPSFSNQKDGAAALEARLAAHQAAWKASLVNRPEDEQAAKDKARAAKDRHDDVMKANRKAARKSSLMQDTVYDGLWTASKRAYRMKRIVAFIKAGMTDTVILLKALASNNKTFYTDLETLKAEGRITSVTEGRKTILAVIAKAVITRKVPFRAFETSFREAIVARKTVPPMATHCAKCGAAYTPATLEDFANCSGHHCSH